MAGDREGARKWYSVARAACGRDRRLLARLGWEMGCLALSEDQIAVAELMLELTSAVLADGLKMRSPDVLHLSALVGERRSMRRGALEDYRRAIALGDHSLTPLTRVIALRNLASALAHEDPRSAAGMCALGLALIEGGSFDERIRPSVENVLAYALICDGKVAEGRERAEGAVLDAARLGNVLTAGNARFNVCIALELLGAPAEADEQLSHLTRFATDARLDELLGWIRLRRSWLSVKRGRPDLAASDLWHHSREAALDAFEDSAATLRAIIDYRAGRFVAAIRALQELADRYARQEDWLTTLAVLLWLACAHDQVGDRASAQAAVAAAVKIGRPRGFRVSPNWWSDDLVEVASRLAAKDEADYCRLLLPSGGSIGSPDAPRIVVARDGLIEVDGTALPDASWQMGRSGSRVLRRLFSCLVAAHPIGVGRDDLADLLWPESDGDRALRNLDSALNDLRHVLRGTDGLNVSFDRERYALAAAPWVVFDQTPGRAAPT